ncbi:hypothetical protein VNO77_22877 [Canavalia gladiata]|uniref:Uncharacterized protein n=1 Tax=Canavalia gladiata TaxID=3824 RepID=A0AAN9QEW2_CANGL
MWPFKASASEDIVMCMKTSLCFLFTLPLFNPSSRTPGIASAETISHESEVSSSFFNVRASKKSSLAPLISLNFDIPSSSFLSEPKQKEALKNPFSLPFISF